MTLTFLGWESFSLLCLVRVTRLPLPIGVALGLDWYDLLANGVAMISLFLRYSLIFLCSDRKGFTPAPQGLHFITWVLLSFLYVCFLHNLWAFRSISIVSSGRLQGRIPKMISQFAASLQAISGSISIYSYAVFGESLYAKGNHVTPCFSMIWKSKGSHLTKCLILILSLR